MKNTCIMTKCVHSIDPLCSQVEHMCEVSIVIIAGAPYDQALHRLLQILYKSIQKCVKSKYNGAWMHTKSFSLNNFKSGCPLWTHFNWGTDFHISTGTLPLTERSVLPYTAAGFCFFSIILPYFPNVTWR